MMRFRIIWFWCVAFAVFIWNTVKGNDWHMAFVDFHLGDGADGRPIRKKLIAKRSTHRLEIYWQEG